MNGAFLFNFRLDAVHDRNSIQIPSGSFTNVRRMLPSVKSATGFRTPTSRSRARTGSTSRTVNPRWSSSLPVTASHGTGNPAGNNSTPRHISCADHGARRKFLFRISRKLVIFGCEPIEDELSEAPERLRRKLNELYSPSRRLKLTRKVSELSSDYVSAGMFAPDALIAAFASAYSLDAFVTINRRHLKQPGTVRKLARVNKRFRLPALRILLPGELLELVS